MRNVFELYQELVKWLGINIRKYKFYLEDAGAEGMVSVNSYKTERG